MLQHAAAAVRTRRSGMPAALRCDAMRCDAMRPEPAKLLTNHVLRECMQDRLVGNIATPGGKSIAGPQVEWKGRRHGPRQARRWAQAWSPEQIANRLLIDFPKDTSMRISHEAI